VTALALHLDGAASCPRTPGKRCFNRTASQTTRYQLLRLGYGCLDAVDEVKRRLGVPALHRDTFDRMLIAQATTDGLTLVTRDTNIHRYDVDVLVA
jgi:PIN domain nuclease of toxin-antitoxin system